MVSSTTASKFALTVSTLIPGVDDVLGACLLAMPNEAENSKSIRAVAVTESALLVIEIPNYNAAPRQHSVHLHPLKALLRCPSTRRPLIRPTTLASMSHWYLLLCRAAMSRFSHRKYLRLSRAGSA